MGRYASHPEYGAMVRKKQRFFVAFILVAVVVSFCTVGIHRYYELDFFESLEVLFDHIMGHPSEIQNEDFIIWDRMVPRVFLGACVGGALGISGAAMQIILHNPLADPYNTGISSGAGLGASLFLILGIAIIPGLGMYYSVVINAFVFSLIPCALIILFSQYKKMTPSQMILVGVAVMMYFGAANTLLILMADPKDLEQAFLWTMGNLGNATWENLPLILGATILGCTALQFLGKKLQALNVGDTYAQTIGENPIAIRRWTLIIVSLMVAVVVSFSGTIGFVGMVAPHIARMLVGSDTRYLFPSSMAVGIVMMLIADIFAKMFILPVGVITSLVGAPLFLYILMKMRKGAYA